MFVLTRFLRNVENIVDFETLEKIKKAQSSPAKPRNTWSSGFAVLSIQPKWGRTPKGAQVNPFCEAHIHFKSLSQPDPWDPQLLWIKYSQALYNSHNRSFKAYDQLRSFIHWSWQICMEKTWVPFNQNKTKFSSMETKLATTMAQIHGW